MSHRPLAESIFRACQATVNIPLLNPDEARRVAALDKYDIVDSAPEAAFDELVQLVAQVCEVPIALISLVHTDRQWFKAKVGVDVCETARDVSFCQYAIRNPEPLIVRDALIDDRFRNSELVVSDPHIRFYAGFPLITPEGFALGSLCAIDRTPRDLNSVQLFALKVFANQVVSQIELRELTRELSVANQELEQSSRVLRTKDTFSTRTLADLSEQVDRLEAWIDLLKHTDEAAVICDRSDTIVFWNPAAEDLYGYTRDEAEGQSFAELAAGQTSDAAGIFLRRTRLGSGVRVNSRQFAFTDLRGETVYRVAFDRPVERLVA